MGNIPLEYSCYSSIKYIMVVIIVRWCNRHFLNIKESFGIQNQFKLIVGRATWEAHPTLGDKVNFKPRRRQRQQQRQLFSLSACSRSMLDTAESQSVASSALFMFGISQIARTFRRERTCVSVIAVQTKANERILATNLIHQPKENASTHNSTKHQRRISKDSKAQSVRSYTI